MRTYATTLALSLILTAGCGGGGGGADQQNNNPPGGGQQLGSAGTITGRTFVPEGQAVGGPFVEVTVRDAAGTLLSPITNPLASGPDAGRFSIAGLPLGVPLTLSVDYESEARGDFLGADLGVTLTGDTGLDVGSVILNNEVMQLGWAAYRAKNFNLALSRFETSKRTRKATSEGFQSSSYLNGIGWTKVKRGRDTVMMCQGTQNAGFEWNEALTNFLQVANTDAFDADARVGAAAAYLALSAKTQLLDMQQFNLQQFFYTINDPFYDEAEQHLTAALTIDPEFDSDHDEISAGDLLVARLFTLFMQEKPVGLEDIDGLSEREDLNLGSRETLQALSDLIEYKTDPQAGGDLTL